MTNTRSIHLNILAMCIALLFASCQKDATVSITNAQCEYLDNPLGLDTPQPRFNWKLNDAKDFLQETYRIRIATDSSFLLSGTPDIWDSGMTNGQSLSSEYSGDKKLQSHQRYYWDVTVWSNKGDSCISSINMFAMGKLSQSDWVASWISDTHDKEYEPAPLFRKEFKVEKNIAHATLYISGTAYYEMFLNGERVGNSYLDPGYTHYNKRILYATHDITSLINRGGNAIGVVLGNGFYNCQSKAVWDFERADWRGRPRLLCELRITYADGTTDVIASDDTWKTNTGPYIYNNIYSGDRYDGRLEEEGWNNTGFDEKNWIAAKIADSPAPLIVSQQMPPIRITKEIKPALLKSFGDTVFVFDLKENIAGVCRLNVKGERGTTFTLQHGELLKDDGRLQPGNIDVYYRPEKPGEVFQTDIFILKGSGKQEEFTPQFTYHGFRYIEVKTDRPVTLTEDNITGLFLHTDIPQVGYFSSSNKLLNKIWAATNQSYRGNIHSIPTDCPQREKNGWTADAHIAMDLALLNFDGITFYEKWMNDFIDNQRPNGGISGIIPSSGWGFGDWPGPVWDAALFIVPNALYDYYADKRCIERLYPTMLNYLEYLKNQEKDGLLTFGLGDWVYYKAQTPNDYTSTLYYYLDYMLMARFATILGKDASMYKEKAESLKKIINDKFFNPETAVYANGTQTAQAIALYLEIVPQGKEQAVADYLQKIVAENNHFLDFGLLGSKTVLRMLSKYGYVEDAYKMATKTEAPSWGYWVETQGYTTLAETWLLSPEFHDASLNHVFMGDISAWMSSYLAGINYDISRPGFENIIIKPYFIADLEWVKGEYNSVRGKISSEWKADGKNIEMTVKIPAGSTATIYAGDNKYNVGSGEHKYRFALK